MEAHLSVVDKAIETQLKNIQAKTGKTLEQLATLLRKSGLTKHGELRDMPSANSAWATAMPTPWSTL